MKYIPYILLPIILSGCGVNVAIRAGIDIDPGLERFTADIKEIIALNREEENK